MCHQIDDLADVIPTYFPVDGPHSDQTISQATASVSGLVRYLNHATLNPESPALAWAATSGRVIGGLSAAIYRLDQLLDQLAAVMRVQATNPACYDDRHDRPVASTTTEVRHHLIQARLHISNLCDALDDAHEAANHLGNND